MDLCLLSGWVTPIISNLHRCSRGGKTPTAGRGSSRALPDKLRGRDLEIFLRLFLWRSGKRNEDCGGLEKKNEPLAISSENYESTEGIGGCAQMPGFGTPESEG